MASVQEQVESKVNQINHKLEKLGKVIEGIQDVVSKKMDNKDADKLEIVEESVLKLVETMEKKRTDDQSLLGCLQSAVQMKVDQDQEESNEIMKRRFCVLVHVIKASTSADSEVRNAQDEDQMVNLLPSDQM